MSDFVPDAAYPGAPGWAKPCNYQPTPQTDTQVEEGLRQAFRKAIDDGIVEPLPVAVTVPAPEGGPISVEELKAAWNAQADEFNQWDSLGLDEQLGWAQAQAVTRYGTPAPGHHQISSPKIPDSSFNTPAQIGRQGPGEAACPFCGDDADHEPPCDPKAYRPTPAPVPVAEPRQRPIWTEGICGDGAALLKDGVMMPIEEVVAELNLGAAAIARIDEFVSLAVQWDQA